MINRGRYRKRKRNAQENSYCTEYRRLMKLITFISVFPCCKVNKIPPMSALYVKFTAFDSASRCVQSEQACLHTACTSLQQVWLWVSKTWLHWRCRASYRKCFRQAHDVVPSSRFVLHFVQPPLWQPRTAVPRPAKSACRVGDRVPSADQTLCQP